MKRKSSRREFLRKSVATGIGLSIIPNIIPPPNIATSLAASSE